MFSGRRPTRGEAVDEDDFSAAALDLLDPLYGAALRLTRNADRAQDLVQDTYLKAIRARDRFERGTNLKAWLYTILHNTWRNRQRDAAEPGVLGHDAMVWTQSDRTYMPGGGSRRQGWVGARSVLRPE